MSTKIELRSQKRKDVVEAIVIRQGPFHLVRRIYNLPERTVFEWPSRYRAGGWDALNKGKRSGYPRKLSAAPFVSAIPIWPNAQLGFICCDPPTA